ncbi:MAG: putative 2-aminoethylphosphonate ABC transporter substrate-binding protein [Candidatus Tectimicrobiota bacterium]
MMAVSLMLALWTVPAGAKTTLLVYTALEADQLKAYKQAFEQDNPDIELRWVRDSTGVITAKLLAEKTNPVADVVWGLAATSLLLLEREALLLPYAPQGLERIKATMRDAKHPPHWVGMDIWASVMCFNTVEAGKHRLPKPTSWADLTRPEYKGHVAMPHPASSGTGYLMVSAWLQSLGEEAGWAYMDALHKNIVSYTHSGSKPCRQAASGEYVVGLSFDYRANKTKKDGGPIDIILPAEGLGWDQEATAILKTSPRLDAAKRLADWAVTPRAQALYAEYYAIVGQPGVAQALEFIPADIETRLMKNDFAWAAAQRDRILAEWSRRYDGKSEPKS